MPGQIEQRLKALGVELPKPAAPVANYVPAVPAGTLLFVSGQLALGPNGLELPGKVGATVGIDDARKAARLCAINVLAQTKAAIGDLERIKRIAKVTGFVNAVPDFVDHPKIVNGASDFFVEVLGDRGRHARSSIGVGSLPLGASVEIEAIIEFA
ncbi:MAG: RidA family protein [Bauldia sp.]